MFALKAGSGEVQLLEGDITEIAVDAMVNAANSALAGGGGVDGAIHDAGGPEIMRELSEIRKRIGRCPAGQAVATGAGLLPAKFVFHAVGPIYRDGQLGEREKLASCYRTCLEMADERQLVSLSFPSISTGVYGYPFEEAADTALATVVAWLNAHEGSTVKLVKLVQFGANDHRKYVDRARKMESGMAGAASR